MTYDSKCYDLAEHFIGSAPEKHKLRHELAQHIQQEIEDWLGHPEFDLKPTEAERTP